MVGRSYYSQKKKLRHTLYHTVSWGIPFLLAGTTSFTLHADFCSLFPPEFFCSLLTLHTRSARSRAHSSRCTRVFAHPSAHGFFALQLHQGFCSFLTLHTRFCSLSTLHTVFFALHATRLSRIAVIAVGRDWVYDSIGFSCWPNRVAEWAFWSGPLAALFLFLVGVSLRLAWLLNCRWSFKSQREIRKVVR